ncbi:uncharacterized protein LOC129222601 [Uloborus diversus]|uniref:uncharacterized protein LOC129222601 n=1 Tax=Uloborus diversus TaxID=327109 RepID=UPI00240A5AC6|nr:uncharacterized protein LOC129222601 [Uloborus diversus]
MTAIIYYVLPMLLGRTYDMRTNKPGVDIFPQSAIDEATVIERHFTDAQYKMVSDTREARDFLGVSGDLSLKIKAGTVNIQGLGNYMKETYSRSNLVEILVKVHYETETLTLPSRAEPRPGWKILDLQDIGTHYVRSITYGGDMVASLRFTAKNAADREMIRAKVQANLQADSGSFGLGIEGNFSRLQEDLKDSSSLEINYYATVPIKGVPNTMESLMELVEEFPEQTQLVNNGKGVPLSMELFPLSALDSELPRYLETKALVDQLDRLEVQFDDIRATKKVLQEWLLNVPPVLTQELEDEVGAFNDELERISFVFYKVLANLNLGENADVGQFKEAFDAYASNGGSLPDKYYRKFQVLKHKIIHSSKVLQTDVGGTTYTHWGHDECGGSQTIYSGTMASTDMTKGGTASIICLTDDPQTDDDDKDYKKHHKFYSKLSPVRIMGRNVSSDAPVSCAACFAGERTSALTFPGRTACPPAWTLEYEGYLATKNFESRRGDYLCVDTDADATKDGALLTVDSDVLDAVSDLGMQCGTLPCDAYENKLTPCVVCSY